MFVLRNFVKVEMFQALRTSTRPKPENPPGPNLFGINREMATMTSENFIGCQ